MSTALASLLVADSFRVRLNPETGNAEVRGLDRHLFRFSRTVREVCGRTLTDVGSFLEHACQEIADYGAGMPRLELLDRERLNLRLRPLPELRTTLDYRSVTDAPRQHAHRKGPHIELFAQLNQRLEAEGLLLNDEGLAVEGTTTSVVWWDGEQLHRAPSDGRVASVTESLVANAAKTASIVIERSSATPEQLAGHEVWALNALHGIRVVASIDGVTLPKPEPRRLAYFQQELEETWQPVR